MKWIEALQGQLVGLDTTPLIYFTEGNPDYHKIVKPFFDAFDLGEFNIVTSIITLAETLVIPLRKGNNEVAQRYRNFLKTDGVDLVDVSWSIAERAAQLRATYGKKIKPPDAIHLATAIEAKATHFLTNDKELRCVTELNILVLDELKAGSPPD